MRLDFELLTNSNSSGNVRSCEIVTKSCCVGKNNFAKPKQMISLQSFLRKSSGLPCLSRNGLNIVKQQNMPSSDVAAFRKKFQSAKHGK